MARRERRRRGAGEAHDLSTLEGLENAARDAGLSKQATEIQPKGEHPKKIYSGGFISDVFDTLNMLQYGVAGVLQGKGFKEGVKSRSSFSDEEALGKYGIAGSIIGTAVDIAIDPLTYLGGLGVLSKASKAVQGTKAARALASKVSQSKIGQRVGSLLVYRFGQDPVYKKMAERLERNVAVGTSNLLDIVRPITKLDNEAQRAIGAARKAGKLEQLPDELLLKAKPAFDELDRLGSRAVEEGLLKKEVYDQNVGSYMARLYTKHEVPEGVVGKVKGIFGTKPVRMDLSRFKKRTDIPQDVRESMGEILEAGYPTAKALVQLNKSVEQASFFREVAKKFSKDTIEDGFELLPKTDRLGALSGKAVPKFLADDINEIIRPAAKGFVATAVASFKFGKVIMNPATHARNIVSNFILNNFEGLSPARLDIYARAAKEVATQGKIYQEAKAVGLGLDTFAAREITDILESQLGKKGVGVTVKTKSAMNKLANMYSKEEEWAKMAQYIFQRGKGLSPEDAYKVAEKATFNYAQVTPFIRRLRESAFGMPFITFTYKATPQVAKTLITKPTKISNLAKIKQGIESQADQDELIAERESEPAWIKDGFFVKLPMKDADGRSGYMDLTYILPFGDLISGNLFARDVDTETQTRESLASAALKKTPLLALITEIGRNQDFYGNKIWKDTDPVAKQTGDLFRHLAKMMAPPLISDQLPGGYRQDGTRRKGTLQRTLEYEKGIEGAGGQTRSGMQEVLRQMGIKIQPLDLDLQQSWQERNRKTALQTLLLERGVTAEFTRPFIPKAPNRKKP